MPKEFEEQIPEEEPVAEADQEEAERVKKLGEELEIMAAVPYHPEEGFEA